MKYGLIGESLSHSYSELIHKKLGMSDYELKSIPPDELEAFFDERDFFGINITIPYKKSAVQFCDELTDTAKLIGSVNTIANRGGKLIGHNTDYAGMRYLIDKSGISLGGKKVIILGSGGTSLTAQAICEDAEANTVVVSRSGMVDYESVYSVTDAEIIINTTPVGMYPQAGEIPLDPSRFPKLCGVVDAVYNPLRTALVISAIEQGIPAVGGLRMLVHQAKCAEEFFFGREIDNSETERVYREMSADSANIVLVGMPGCGKSTIAAILAEKTGREVLDTDILVEKQAGMTVQEIFAKLGEESFRRMEREAVSRAGMLSGKIIATGGGAVLDRANFSPLVQNGRVYFIEREIELLAREGRPLSVSPERVREMYGERLQKYLDFAHKRINNNGSPQSAVERILEDFYENFCY